MLNCEAALLEKLTVPQLVKKFEALHGTTSFVTYNLYCSIPFALLNLAFIFIPSLQTLNNK
jgi:hypothetical protein